MLETVTNGAVDGLGGVVHCSRQGGYEIWCKVWHYEENGVGKVERKSRCGLCCAGG